MTIYLIILVNPFLVILKPSGPLDEQRRSAKGKVYRHQGVVGGGQTKRCLVGKHWLMLKLFSSIILSGLLFNLWVASLTYFQGLHFISVWLLIVSNRCCLTVQLLLPYGNSLVYRKIS